MVLKGVNVCIVMPMYNEDKIAETSLGAFMAYLSELPESVKMLVVDDGSKDNTPEILRKWSGRFPDRLVCVSHDINKGYGSALRTGINYAIGNGYDYVLFTDSDLTNHPKYLRDFYRLMESGYDYIKASRFAKGAGVAGVPWHRRLVSCAGNAVARVLFGLPVQDITNGYRAVKTDLLKKFMLRENGFAVIMEELYLAGKYARSYAQVPYVLTSRSDGQGGTHFRYDMKTYWSYLKYALKAFRDRARVISTKKGI